MLELCVRWLVLLFETSLKAALLALVAAAVLRFLRIHDCNFRHRTLCGVLAGMLTLPALTYVIPAIRLPFLTAPQWLAEIGADHEREAARANLAGPGASPGNGDAPGS